MSEKKQRELRVRCLVLDHDDTVVKSTPEINFPAFLRSLKDLRGTTMSYEQFVEYNFDPGFYEMCADILHYTPMLCADPLATSSFITKGLNNSIAISFGRPH